MAYDFFLSYPRAETEADPFLQRFYNDLSKEVRRISGRRGDVGFFDQIHIEGGTDWRSRLLGALNESKTIVPMFMPAFYNSDECRRELELFQSRLSGLQRQHAVVKPVLWTTGVVPMPDDLKAMQYTYGDANAAVNTKGLLYLYRKNRSRVDFLEQLALEIVNAANEGPPLPPIIGPYQREQPLQAVPIEVAGPGHVHFVYVATSADKLPPRQDAAAYGLAPKAWRPFHPPTASPIGPMTQEAAGSIDFTSDELSCDDQLVSAMRDAERKRNLVVLLVDGWSVQLAELEEVLRTVDEHNFVNAGIVVPLNENDPETALRASDLRDSVRAALFRWSESNDKLRFDDSITKLEQLKPALADKLVRLRAKVFSAGRGRPTPQVPRPTLINTGTPA